MKTPAEIVREWELDLDKAVDRMIDAIGIETIEKEGEDRC